MKVLIDSSAWLELFSNGKRAKSVEKYLKSTHHNVLPSIVSYEVYKKLKRTSGESIAVMLLAQMERLSSAVATVDQGLAIKAADVSLQYDIPMADAIIYASATITDAMVVTLDKHFLGLHNVELLE